MANQSQPRPWFHFGPMARPIQLAGPPPAPRPAAAPLPRPTMIRPPFRPLVAAPPQLAQDVAAPPQLPSVTTPARLQPLPPPVVAPMGARNLLTRIAHSSPDTRKSPRSPATQNFPHAPSSTQRSPPYASSTTRKSPNPAAPGTRISLLSSPVTRESPPRSVLSSPFIKQEIAKSVSNSPSKQSTPKYAASPSVPRATQPLPKTLPESPNIKPAPHSPPSFSLPPSQLHSDGEYERDIPTIAEQKTVKPRSFSKPHHDNPKNSPAGINVKSKERETKMVSNREDSGMSVITISGENRGAVMELSYSPGTHSTPHQLRGNGESSKGDLSRDEGRTNHVAKAKPSKPMHAFMNNNVQGINGSVVFNSTLSFLDPGIHFRLSRKPDKGHRKDHANGQNMYSD